MERLRIKHLSRIDCVCWGQHSRCWLLCAKVSYRCTGTQTKAKNAKICKVFRGVGLFYFWCFGNLFKKNLKCLIFVHEVCKWRMCFAILHIESLFYLFGSTISYLLFKLGIEGIQKIPKATTLRVNHFNDKYFLSAMFFLIMYPKNTTPPKVLLQSMTNHMLWTSQIHKKIWGKKLEYPNMIIILSLL